MPEDCEVPLIKVEAARRETARERASKKQGSSNKWKEGDLCWFQHPHDNELYISRVIRCTGKTCTVEVINFYEEFDVHHLDLKQMKDKRYNNQAQPRNKHDGSRSSDSLAESSKSVGASSSQSLSSSSSSTSSTSSTCSEPSSKSQRSQVFYQPPPLPPFSGMCSSFLPPSNAFSNVHFHF